MVKITKKLMTGEEGYIFAVTLILLMLGALLLPYLLSFMSTGIKTSQVFENEMYELYAADAGIEDAIRKILDNTATIPESYDLADNVNRKAVHVSLVDYLPENDTPKIKITSTAGSTVIVAYISVLSEGLFWDPETVPEEDRIMSGNLELGPGVYNGDVYLGNGNLILEEGVTLYGNVYLENGNIQFIGGGTINGDIIAENGNLQLVGGGTVNGDVWSRNGSIQIDSNTSISGVAVADNGDIQLGENSQIGSGGCASGNIQLQMNAYIGNDVYAGGNIQMEENATIDGDAYLSGSLDDSKPGAVVTGDVFPYGGCELTSQGSFFDMASYEIH